MYYLIKVERCARCNGSGYVRHPAWGRYWIEYVERVPGDEGLRRWLPDEEETCPDCEGLGSIRTEVPNKGKDAGTIALEAISLYREYVEQHGYDPERAAAAAALEVAEGQQALEEMEAGNAS